MSVLDYLRKETEDSLELCNKLSIDLKNKDKEIEQNELTIELYNKTFKLNAVSTDEDYRKIEFGDTFEYYERRENAKLSNKKLQRKSDELNKERFGIQKQLEIEINNYITLKKRLSWFTGEDYE